MAVFDIYFVRMKNLGFDIETFEKFGSRFGKLSKALWRTVDSGGQQWTVSDNDGQGRNCLLIKIIIIIPLTKYCVYGIIMSVG